MLKQKIAGIKFWNKAYLYKKKNINLEISVILKTKHEVPSTFAKTKKPWHQQQLSPKKILKAYS